MKRKWNKVWFWLLSLAFAHELLALVNGPKIVVNPGISWGINFSGVSLAVTIILLYILYLWNKSGGWGWLCLFGGGFVNCLDRWRFSGVRDYWPILEGRLYNNINDWVIFIGILLLLYSLIWKK